MMGSPESAGANGGARAWAAAWLPPAAIALLAVAARCYRLYDGIPYAVGIDEPAILDRVLLMLRTGDLNPHFFDYPGLVFYLQLVLGYVRYLYGLAGHEWGTSEAMDAAALYAPARVAAAALALGGVYWIYRAGCEVESRALGLMAAAALAVFPQHVRESHFVLADIPATSFATLALWLALRAARSSTTFRYGVAGAAAGLAAAAKYNGAVVFVSILALWVTEDRPWRHVSKLLLSAAAAVAVFLVFNPYVVLDWAAFSSQFGELVRRFTAHSPSSGDLAWLVYYQHLSNAGTGWVPLAALGLGLGVITGRRRREWVIVAAFAVAYFGLLATNARIFGRYALPMIPALCLLAALPFARLANLAAKRIRIRGIAPMVLCCGSLLFLVPFSRGSFEWLQQARRTDTREIAATWLRAAAPPGTRIAVENSGPTNLDHAGFSVLQKGRVLDQPVSWYASHDYRYIVVSSWNMPAYEAFIEEARMVFRVTPDRGRWGPRIDILEVLSTTR